MALFRECCISRTKSGFSLTLRNEQQVLQAYSKGFFRKNWDPIFSIISIFSDYNVFLQSLSYFISKHEEVLFKEMPLQMSINIPFVIFPISGRS